LAFGPDRVARILSLYEIGSSAFGESSIGFVCFSTRAFTEEAGRPVKHLASH
jgi:hypothetical protein